MGEVERSPASRALDALVEEAKEHLSVPGEAGEGVVRETRPAPRRPLADVDWSRLEARTMAAVEDERPALVGDLAPNASALRRATAACAVALAAAAAVIVFARADRDPGVGDVTASADEPASSLRTTEGAGEVRVDGVVAAPGHVMHAGASIESAHARAIFERPGKVTWLLEQEERAAAPAARARVKSAGEPLVVGLEHGVIEADVVPVAAGEAFAIDVATERGIVRVAVHGTHLRVARAGDQVVVDLTEGVVSIGTPPRSGPTYGTLVTAPAHVELDATDLRTIRVDHATVREPVALDARVGAARPDAPRLSPPPPKLAPSASRAVEEAPASRARPNPPTRDAIAAGVRACAATHARSGEVRVTLSSTLRLRVSPTGAVASAQFSPPLSPEIQRCAAQLIYKAKLDETGLVTIPIDLSY